MTCLQLCSHTPWRKVTKQSLICTGSSPDPLLGLAVLRSLFMVLSVYQEPQISLCVTKVGLSSAPSRHLVCYLNYAASIFEHLNSILFTNI